MNIKGRPQCLFNTWCIWIMLTLALIQGTNSIHFIRSQFKIKDFLVGLDPGFMNRLWKDNYAFLVLKAQHYLADILAVLLGNSI